MISANLWERTAGDPVEASQSVGEVKVDVIIIGGGFTGCAAALQLARSGSTVCLLEANTVGHGGSGRNVGLVNAGLWLEPDKVEAALGRSAGSKLNAALAAGPDSVFALIEQYGIACQPNRSGTLHCAHSTSGWSRLQRRANQYCKRGARVRLLTREETRVKTGCDQYIGALLDPRAGTIQPLAYARGLANAAIAQGASVYQGSAVHSVEYHNQVWWARTAQACVQADALILATNAYHQELQISARPQCIQLSFFQCATRPLRAEVRDTILPERQGAWDTAPVMTSFRMDAEGRLIVGAVGSLEKMGASIHQAWIRRKLDLMFPAARGQAFDYAWSGRIAMTADHLPKIIKIGRRALSIYGYSGRGIGPGTVFGTAAAKYLLSGDEDDLPIAPIHAHDEKLRKLRQVGYEFGASVFHLLSDRRVK